VVRMGLENGGPCSYHSLSLPTFTLRYVGPCSSKKTQQQILL
jgi:hypothetical protein